MMGLFSKKTQPSFSLGTKLRDTVSGFEGIAVCKTEWLNGCVRYAVQGKVSKEGAFTDASWFDAEQLEVAGPGIRTKSEPSGGGRPDPSRPAPTR